MCIMPQEWQCPLVAAKSKPEVSCIGSESISALKSMQGSFLPIRAVIPAFPTFLGSNPYFVVFLSQISLYL